MERGSEHNFTESLRRRAAGRAPRTRRLVARAASLPRLLAGRRGRAAFMFPLLSLVCVASFTSSSALAWQGRPKIADEVEGTPDRRTTPARPPEHRAPADSRTPRRRAAPPAPPAPRPVALLNVTLSTGLPDSDIYLHRGGLSMQKLGRTGADGTAVVRLPAGDHTVIASRIGAPTLRQQIAVRPGSTSFAFNVTGRAVPAAANGVPLRALTAEDAIRRFLDPKQTEALTAADWQSAYEHAYAAHARNPLEPQAEAQALFARGQLAYTRGDYASALVDFNAAALKLPNSALAFYGLGNAYYATNQLGEAARAYQRAAELNTNLALAYRGLGDVLSKQGKSKEALAHYERARALGYTSPETSLAAARALLKQRRWQQALRELTELSRTHPTAEVFVGIGDCYVGLRQPLSAAPAYRRAIELDPRSPSAQYKFGELAFQTREYAAAMDALERALALDPEGTYINRQRARDMVKKAAERVRQMD